MTLEQSTRHRAKALATVLNRLAPQTAKYGTFALSPCHVDTPKTSQDQSLTGDIACTAQRLNSFTKSSSPRFNQSSGSRCTPGKWHYGASCRAALGRIRIIRTPFLKVTIDSARPAIQVRAGKKCSRSLLSCFYELELRFNGSSKTTGFGFSLKPASTHAFTCSLFWISFIYFFIIGDSI